MNFIEKSNGAKKKLNFFSHKGSNRLLKYSASSRNASNSKKESTPSSKLNWGKSRQSISSSGVHSETSINNEESRVVLALSEGRGEARCEVGLALINVAQPHLILCQISDTQSYDNTLRKINIFNPSQILVPMTFVDSANTSRLIEKVKEQFPLVTHTPVRRNTYNKTSGMEFIQELCVSSHNSVLLVLQYRYYALTAASALFKFLQNNLNIFYASNSIKIEYQESEGYAVIDVSTADRLELVSSTKPLQASKYSTLFGVLNNCYTRIGERALRTLLLQPPFVTSIILERQQCVTALIRHPEKLQSIQVMLQKLGNVDLLLTLPMIVIDDSQSCSNRQLNYILYLNGLVNLIITLSEVVSTFDQKLFKNISITLKNRDFIEIRDAVRTLINENAYAAKSHNGLLQRCFAIKPGINGLLDLVRKIYSERLDDMRDYVKTLADKYDLPLTLGNNITKGYHIVLSLNKHQRLTMKKSDIPREFIQVCRLAGSFTMKTMELLNFQTRIDDIIADILKISNVMIFKTLTSFKKYMGLFYKLCEDVALMDVLQSLAEVSIRNNYVKPTFSDFTEVKESHHPMLDMLAHEKPVPNRISSCRNFNLHIITGPNGSGKSIYIRQVMLLQIMAQAGGYVPASSAIFRPADRLFARVYLEDNMECGASSFVLEMKEIIYILSHLTDSSLVIIDELARSTSLEEGAALAMAICESFVESSAFVYLTSHFTLVTKLGDLYLNVKNWFMDTEASGNTPKSLQLNFKHSLKSGVTNLKRYGIFMVKNIWPSDLLEDIYRLLEQNTKAQKEVKTMQLSKEARLKYNLEADLRRCRSDGQMIPSKINELMNNYQYQFENLNLDHSSVDRIEEPMDGNLSYFDNTVPEDILSDAVDQLEYSMVSSKATEDSSYNQLSHFLGENSENINLLNPIIHIHESNNSFNGDMNVVEDNQKLHNFNQSIQISKNGNRESEDERNYFVASRQGGFNPNIQILSNVLLNGNDEHKENDSNLDLKDDSQLYSNLKSCSQVSSQHTQDFEEFNEVNRSLLTEMKNLKENLNSEEVCKDQLMQHVEGYDQQDFSKSLGLGNSFEQVQAPMTEQLTFDSVFREDSKTSDFCFLKPTEPPKRFSFRSQSSAKKTTEDLNETYQMAFSLNLLQNRDKTSTPISSRKDKLLGDFIDEKFQSETSIEQRNTQYLTPPQKELIGAQKSENQFFYTTANSLQHENKRKVWSTQNSSDFQFFHIFPKVDVLDGPNNKSLSFGEEDKPFNQPKTLGGMNQENLEQFAIEETRLLLSDSADLFDGDVNELEITVESDITNYKFNEKRAESVISMLKDEKVLFNKQKHFGDLEKDVNIQYTQFPPESNISDDCKGINHLEHKKQIRNQCNEENESNLDEYNTKNDLVQMKHAQKLTTPRNLFEEPDLDTYLNKELTISKEQFQEINKQFKEANNRNDDVSKPGSSSINVGKKNTISTSISEASRKRNLDNSTSTSTCLAKEQINEIEEENWNPNYLRINQRYEDECTSRNKTYTSISTVSRKRNLDNSSSTLTSSENGEENEPNQETKKQTGCLPTRKRMNEETEDTSSKDKVTTSISDASRKRNLDISVCTSSPDDQYYSMHSNEKDSSFDPFTKKMKKTIATEDNITSVNERIVEKYGENDQDGKMESSACYETAVDTDLSSISKRRNLDNSNTKTSDSNEKDIDKNERKQKKMVNVFDENSRSDAQTLSKISTIPFERSDDESSSAKGKMDMSSRNDSRNTSDSAKIKNGDLNKTTEQNPSNSIEEDSLESQASVNNVAKKRKYLGYRRRLPSQNKPKKIKKEENKTNNPSFTNVKLSKYQIQEEFDKQDQIVLEENLDIETYNKYLMQRMNRPSIKQIQNAEYIATFRKTENGAIALPTKKKTYKARKTKAKKSFESGAAIDMSIFSDKNASKLSAFLASNERNYSRFKFTSEYQAVDKDSLTRSVNFCSQFVQKTKKVEFGRSKSFGEFKFHDFTRVSQSRSFKIDGALQSQLSDSGSIFLPDGFFKENKREIDDICSKYLKQGSPFRFFKTITSPL